jgi:hypothetical protein
MGDRRRRPLDRDAVEWILPQHQGRTKRGAAGVRRDDLVHHRCGPHLALV